MLLYELTKTEGTSPLKAVQPSAPRNDDLNAPVVRFMGNCEVGFHYFSGTRLLKITLENPNNNNCV